MNVMFRFTSALTGHLDKESFFGSNSSAGIHTSYVGDVRKSLISTRNSHGEDGNDCEAQVELLLGEFPALLCVANLRYQCGCIVSTKSFLDTGVSFFTAPLARQ